MRGPIQSSKQSSDPLACVQLTLGREGGFFLLFDASMMTAVLAFVVGSD